MLKRSGAEAPDRRTPGLPLRPLEGSRPASPEGRRCAMWFMARTLD
jgi:hypothetical protein